MAYLISLITQMLNQSIDSRNAQLIILLTCLFSLIDVICKDMPDFVEPVQNISVPTGREAVLQCQVRNLNDYRVAWLQSDAETGTLLTLHNTVISKDSRIRVSQSSARNWNLHIKDVKEQDRGYYMCQINTQPMISQVGYLDVLVPPKIVDEETSSDAIVDERSKLSLFCKAKGYPSPSIIWRREDSKELNLGYYSGKKHSAIKLEGEHLNISQITREDMGAYLCIASNGVPPSVSKRFFVQVNFRPKIRVYDQLIGVEPGSTVVMECYIESSPKPLTSWLRQDNLFLLPSSKYEITEEVNSYRIKMKLRIKKVENKDYGAYKCVAKNTLGEKEGYIRLYRPEVRTPPTTTTTTTTTTQSPRRITPFEPKQPTDDIYEIDGLSSNVHDILSRGEYAHNPNRDFNLNGNNHQIYNSKNDINNNDFMMNQNQYNMNDQMRSGAKLYYINCFLFIFLCLRFVLFNC